MKKATILLQVNVPCSATLLLSRSLESNFALFSSQKRKKRKRILEFEIRDICIDGEGSLATQLVRNCAAVAGQPALISSKIALCGTGPWYFTVLLDFPCSFSDQSSIINDKRVSWLMWSKSTRSIKSPSLYVLADD